MGNRRKIWLACGAIGLPLSAAAQQVRQVQISETGDRVAIHLVGDKLPKPAEVKNWRRGVEYTFEWPAGMDGTGKRVKLRSADVSSVWYGWFSAKPKKIRVELFAKHEVTPQVTQVADGWIVSVGGAPAVAKAASHAVPPAKAKLQALKLHDDMPIEAPHKFVAMEPGSQDEPVLATASRLTPKHVKAMLQSYHVSERPTQGARNVSIDCTNADLAQVLKGLAMQSGANIVIGPEVKGKVTANLHDVSIDDALRYLAQLTGVKFTRENGVYMFGMPEPVKVPGAIVPPSDVPNSVKVVPILSDSENEVKKTLEATFKGKDLQILTPGEAKVSDQNAAEHAKEESARGASAVQAGDNEHSLVMPQSYLILVGAPEVVVDADRLARMVDSEIVKAHADYEEVDRIDREMFVYEVKFADPRALREELLTQLVGIRASVAPNSSAAWQVYKEQAIKKQGTEDNGESLNQQQQNQQGGAGGGGGGGTVGTSSTTEVSDGQLESPYSKEEAVSVPMRLVLRGTHEQILQALEYLKKLDVAPRQVAIELRVMELTKEQALNAGIDWNILTGGAVKILNLHDSISNPANSIGASLSGPNFSGDVTASLDRITTANNLVARPNLVAIDGRQSEVFVGDIVRYIESITSSQNGVSITTGEVPVGVRLSLLPRIGADGNILLDLRPRVSLLTSFTPVPGGGELPQTSTRFVQDTVSMQSGQTLAIGGLIQDQDTRNVTGIPVLMNLPLLGNLFKSTANTRTRTEFVIFLTARAIDGPLRASGNTLDITKDFEQLPKKDGHK